MRTHALAAALALCAAPGFAAEPVLLVDGAWPQARAFGASALRAMPRRAATREDHGVRIRCEGVPLAELLRRAGLPTGKALRGPALTTVVVATGADGYRVAFTLGELDPSLGDAAIIVADRCDARPLEARTGPFRLVAPGDHRGARSVRRLVRLTVVRA